MLSIVVIIAFLNVFNAAWPTEMASNSRAPWLARFVKLSKLKALSTWKARTTTVAKGMTISAPIKMEVMPTAGRSRPSMRARGANDVVSVNLIWPFEKRCATTKATIVRTVCISIKPDVLGKSKY